MKAAIYRRFGPPEVLELGEVPEPKAPGPGEMLVRVRAAGLNPRDVILSRGRLRLLTRPGFPKRVGNDWAGEVLAVGPGVRGVEVGARWHGMIDVTRTGAIAERIVARVAESAPIPAALSFAEAASVPLAALTALQGLVGEGALRAGQRVLIHGASGGVGVFAIQIAKALGAHVTTTSSARNLELCRSLGADEVLDYAARGPTELDGRFDVFFDVFGNQRFAKARRVLTERGRYVQTVPSPTILLDVLRTRLLRGPSARLVVVRARGEDLRRIDDWIVSGAVRPVIDRVLPWTEIRDGFAHLATKRARGKVVLEIG
ncbi:MAG: NAD(P)-dependent alcohol dehydrogenase [Sandaracinaceae bacterium]